MTINIQFTEAAANYCKKMVGKEAGIALRLSVKKTGCSGFAYHVAVLKEMNDLDFVFQLQNGLTILVDQTWLHFLQGLQIDYVMENNVGLKQSRLIFKNENESERCGCGKSFHIEKDDG